MEIIFNLLLSLITALEEPKSATKSLVATWEGAAQE